MESAPVPVDALNTPQKQAEVTNLLRVSSGTSSSPSAVTSVTVPTATAAAKTSTISGASFGTVNEVENIFTLNKGESIMDIIISHYHSSSTTSVFGLYWSSSPENELTFTVSSGVIPAVTGGTIFRLVKKVAGMIQIRIPQSDIVIREELFGDIDYDNKR